MFQFQSGSCFPISESKMHKWVIYLMGKHFSFSSCVPIKSGSVSVISSGSKFSFTYRRNNEITKNIEPISDWYKWGLIEKKKAKKKAVNSERRETTVKKNLIFFVLVYFRSHTLHPVLFPMIEAFLEFFFWGGDSETLPGRILLDCLDFLKSSSPQVGFDFWKERKVGKGETWVIWWLPGLENVNHG